MADFVNIKLFLDKINSGKAVLPVKIAVTVAVVYLVNKSLPKNGLSGLAERISPGYSSLAIIIGFLIFFIQARRWRVVLASSGINIDEATAWRTMLWGCLLAFITPGRTGEFFRGISLPANRKSDTVWAVAADKILAGFGVIAAGAISLPVCFLYHSRIMWPHWTIGAASVAFFSGIYMVYMLRHRKAVRKVLDRAPVFTGKKLCEVCIYSVSAQVLCCIQTAVLFRMFGGCFSVLSLSAAGMAYTFMMLFPFFIANMGIREFSFGMFLSGYFSSAGQSGVADIAFGASMGILAINIVLPALAGLCWWLIYKKDMAARVF